jgi:hypothetical protein
MSARKPAPIPLSPEKQEAVRRIAEAERAPAEKIPAEGVNSPATGTAVAVATAPLPEPQEAVSGPVLDEDEDDDYLWQFVEEEELRVPMTIRVPQRMRTALKRIEKFSNMTMTDVLVEGARPIIKREIAKIKARGVR